MSRIWIKLLISQDKQVAKAQSC